MGTDPHRFRCFSCIMNCRNSCFSDLRRWALTAFNSYYRKALITTNMHPFVAYIPEQANHSQAQQQKTVNILGNILECGGTQQDAYPDGIKSDWRTNVGNFTQGLHTFSAVAAKSLNACSSGATAPACMVALEVSPTASVAWTGPPCSTLGFTLSLEISTLSKPLLSEDDSSSLAVGSSGLMAVFHSQVCLTPGYLFGSSYSFN